jgi:hypothetical protein
VNIEKEELNMFNYLDTELPQEKLHYILSVAVQRVHAKGKRHITVFSGESVKRISGGISALMKKSGDPGKIKAAEAPGYDPLRGAPVLLLVTYDKEEPYGAVACGVVTHQLIEASLALGVTPQLVPEAELLMYADDPEGMRQKWGIPPTHAFVSGIVLGYAPAEDTADCTVSYNN